MHKDGLGGCAYTKGSFFAARPYNCPLVLWASEDDTVETRVRSDSEL